MSTQTTTPAEIIDDCKALLGRLDKDRWPGGARVSNAVSELRDVTEIWDAINRDLLHPASEYQELAGHPEAKWEALKMAAQDAQDCKDEVERLMAEALAAEEVQAA